MVGSFSSRGHYFKIVFLSLESIALQKKKNIWQTAKTLIGGRGVLKAFAGLTSWNLLD